MRFWELYKHKICMFWYHSKERLSFEPVSVTNTHITLDKLLFACANVSVINLLTTADKTCKSLQSLQPTKSTIGNKKLDLAFA